MMQTREVLTTGAGDKKYYLYYLGPRMTGVVNENEARFLEYYSFRAMNHLEYVRVRLTQEATRMGTILW